MAALLAQSSSLPGTRRRRPPKLSSRVRLLERGKIDKTDPNDAVRCDRRWTTDFERGVWPG